MFRGFLGLVATVLVVGLLVSVGAGIYQAGVAQGVVDAGRFPAGATVPVAGYGYGWHQGPDLFGLVFGLIFLFILFGIIRAAFFGGRGGRGWGHHGYRYGRGPWGEGDGPRSWRDDREGRIADWHRRLHEEDTARGASDGSATPPGGAPTTSPSAGSGT